MSGDGRPRVLFVGRGRIRFPLGRGLERRFEALSSELDWRQLGTAADGKPSPDPRLVLARPFPIRLLDGPLYYASPSPGSDRRSARARSGSRSARFPRPGCGLRGGGSSTALSTGSAGRVAVDRLARVAMDAGRDESVRIAAVRALGELDSATIAPLLEALRQDPSEAVQTATKLTVALDPDDVISRAADRGLPEDPADLGKR